MRRKILLAAPCLLLLLALLPDVSPVAAAQAPTSAEARALSLINAHRRDRGRVRLLWDARLADVAQARSEDMAAKDYFAHISKDRLAAMVADEGIVQYRLVEVIQWNMESAADDSARAAVRWWMGSDIHRTLLMDGDFNYIAFGHTLDRSNGHRIWTGLIIKGPDRTGARAWMESSAVAEAGPAADGTREVTIRWDGRDVRLSVLTAGLRNMAVRMRPQGGEWTLVVKGSTDRSITLRLPAGKVTEFQAHGRDRNGNVGRWSKVLSVSP